MRDERTRAWLDEYAKSTSPTEKQATERTRKTNGERLIQIKTHQGTRWPGERLQNRQRSSAIR